MASNSQLQYLHTVWAQYIAVEEVRSSRWIQTSTGRPCRQKTLAGQRTNDRDQARVQQGNHGLWYFHNVEGQIYPIITIDQMCKHVMDAWDSTGLRRRDFEAYLVKEFVGTRTWDVRFILNSIQENRRAAKARRPSTPVDLSRSSSLSPQPTQAGGDENIDDESIEVMDPAASREPGDEQSALRNQHVKPHAQYNQTQKNIFDSVEVHDLLKGYLAIISGPDNGTHHYQSAKEASRIVHAKRLGKAQTFKERADLFIASGVKLAKHLQDGPGNKVVMIQDATQTQDDITAEQIFHDLRQAASKLNLQIDVADPGRLVSTPIATTISVEEAERRWNDQNTFPIQLLNLPPVFRSAPAYITLQSGFPFLDEAIISANMFADLLERYPQTLKDSWENQTLASLMIEKEIANDTDSFAQAGTFRRWSMDPLAAFTLITVEGKTANTNSNQSEDPLVLLSFIRTDHLQHPKITEIYKEFAKTAPSYEPPAKYIRTVCLRKSDSLLLPPGTIYSLIVVNDAYVMESRAMTARFLPDHIYFWRYITNFPQCIDRDPPRQTRRIIYQVQKAVLYDPIRYGYGDEQVEEFVEACAVISRDDLACRCGAMLGCNEESGCGCVTIGLPCAASCHYGDGERCGNPNGCCAED